MTVLCAVLLPSGEVVVGADSQLTRGHIASRLDMTKWHVSPGASHAVGFTGHPVIQRLAVAALDATLAQDPAPGSDVQLFARELVRCVREVGWQPTNCDGDAPHVDACVVWASRGCLAEVCPATGYVEHYPPGLFGAWGSGRDFALGAAHGQEGSREIDVRHETSEGHARTAAVTVVSRAVAAAIEYDLHSGGEPWVGIVGTERSE